MKRRPSLLSEYGFCVCVQYSYCWGAWLKEEHVEPFTEINDLFIHNQNQKSRIRLIPIPEYGYGHRGEHLPRVLKIDPLEYELPEKKCRLLTRV